MIGWKEGRPMTKTIDTVPIRIEDSVTPAKPGEATGPGVTGPVVLGPGEADLPSQAKRPSRKLLLVALGVAAVSDLLSLGVDLILPAQWALDVVTAFLIFLILGRRWAILPGLIAEAIPGLGVFPVWVLVVISIILYDDIKVRKR
jgi:hypothetical protein